MHYTTCASSYTQPTVTGLEDRLLVHLDMEGVVVSIVTNIHT